MDHTFAQVMNAVAVEFAEVYAGLAQAHGLVRDEGDCLCVEYQVQDGFVGAIKSRVKQVRIPLSELAHVRLHQSAFARWFRLGGNLIVQANGLDFFKDTPGASQGRLSLHVANRDMPEAQQLVSDLMQVGRLTSAPPRIAK